MLSKRAVDDEGPGFLKIVNRVSALLTQKAIIQLNADVELDQRSPVAVAKTFLKDNHMLSGQGESQLRQRGSGVPRRGAGAGLVDGLLILF